jgi:hypothetical protein
MLKTGKHPFYVTVPQCRREGNDVMVCSLETYKIEKNELWLSSLQQTLIGLERVREVIFERGPEGGVGYISLPMPNVNGLHIHDMDDFKPDDPRLRFLDLFPSLTRLSMSIGHLDSFPKLKWIHMDTLTLGKQQKGKANVYGQLILWILTRIPKCRSLTIQRIEPSMDLEPMTELDLIKQIAMRQKSPDFQKNANLQHLDLQNNMIMDTSVTPKTFQSIFPVLTSLVARFSINANESREKLEALIKDG